MKKRSVYLPFFLFLAFGMGIYLGGSYFGNSSSTEQVSSRAYKNKLHKLIEFIEREYVDDFNTDSIVDLTVNDILSNLDPHSVYIPRDEMASISESMRGDFVGIGINFYQYKDTIAVIKPISGGPSEKAGIKGGDRILEADGKIIYGRDKDLDSITSTLRGELGSKVQLKVYRKTDKKIHQIEVERNQIPLKSVDVGLMLDDGLGYIKINRFNEKTYEEFMYHLRHLKKQSLNSLVIDLRDNVGGYMEQAVRIADEFLEDKSLIVYTQNKSQRIDKSYATEKGEYEKGELYVLINENTASASEILAGAIQDNDRGVLIGRRTFGKGFVQREMPLGDGSFVRLTVSRYFTPSGRSIQKPYEEDRQVYYHEFDKRFANGELFEKDSIKIADSLKFKTVKGRTVYGGGGIIPDVFVPISSKHGEDFVDRLMQYGWGSNFVFQLIDEERAFWEEKSVEEIREIITSDSKYILRFSKELERLGFTRSLEKNKEQITQFLIAEFVQQLLNDELYYQQLLQFDSLLKKVKELR